MFRFHFPPVFPQRLSRISYLRNPGLRDPDSGPRDARRCILESIVAISAIASDVTSANNVIPLRTPSRTRLCSLPLIRGNACTSLPSLLSSSPLSPFAFHQSRFTAPPSSIFLASFDQPTYPRYISETPTNYDRSCL